MLPPQFKDIPITREMAKIKGFICKESSNSQIEIWQRALVTSVQFAIITKDGGDTIEFFEFCDQVVVRNFIWLDKRHTFIDVTFCSNTNRILTLIRE